MTENSIKMNYRKNKNNNFLKYLEEMNEINISNLQNYIPIYNSFFSLNENNFNSINLNNKWELSSLEINKDSNEKIAVIKNIEGQSKKVPVFFKFSPLVDPIRYLVGKYEDENIFLLPNLNNSCNKKMRDINNSAYIDSFFYYLSSKICEEHYCPNCIDFYGSYLGIKKDFQLNIDEETEILYNSEFFHKNKDIIFSLNNPNIDDLFNEDSRKYKNKLSFGENLDSISISTVSSLKELDGLLEDCKTNNNEINELDIIFNDSNLKKSNSSTNSNCSSRSSITDDEESLDSNSVTSEKSAISQNSENSENKELSSLDSDNNSKLSSEEYSSENSDIGITINKFPVQMIAIESCKETLDNLLENSENLEDIHIISALFQVIITLLIYRLKYNFNHNDLHTNNIMFVNTDREFLYYKYQDNYFKVPTFGKIYKIIDFGRATFKFKGRNFISDSFHKDGDAGSQYNMEPYFNSNKPRLEPNGSFDLCRLGCSLYDLYIPEDFNKNEDEYTPLMKLIEEWCTDDKGKNILYKKNGEERYPSFKLYKMISRLVSKHTPEAQIYKDIFSCFKTNRKSLPKKASIVNIDSMERSI
tara:strand:- start:848 stop:2608 length:1761 start_codon:yes stop_codon:yes gene_type:complete